MTLTWIKSQLAKRPGAAVDSSSTQSPSSSQRRSLHPDDEFQTLSKTRTRILGSFWPRCKRKAGRGLDAGTPVEPDNTRSGALTVQLEHDHSQSARPTDDMSPSGDVTNLAPSESAQEPVLQQASESPATRLRHTSTERRWPEAAMNGLILALKVTKEAASVFPPLQSVAGGLLAIADIVKQVSANEADIHTLRTYIDQLNKVVSPTSLPPVAQWPVAFKDRLSDLEIGVKGIEANVQELASSTLVGKAMNAQECSGKISDCLQSLAWLVQCFVVRGTISLEFGINRVYVKMDEGLQHIDGRFDGVHEHIDSLRAHIGQVRMLWSQVEELY
ncbi:hypothetical protein FKP32DRAFT_1090584 [Trametes sanguinea]|nr:hypothetical protein FKP32DRAFT_1090584 [Trametes sanguinea]